MSKKNWIITGVAVLLVFFCIRMYNKMIANEERVIAQWANVETQYQRRADLIPNLVSTVKGYAEHESSTLEAVISARAKATSTTVDPSNLNAASIQQFQQAQGELSSALSRLLVSVERYPDLKANQNFLELQAQLEGTENRISVERSRFNKEVEKYNVSIRGIPNGLIASIGGFERKTGFAAQEGAENAPKVEF